MALPSCVAGTDYVVVQIITRPTVPSPSMLFSLIFPCPLPFSFGPGAAPHYLQLPPYTPSPSSHHPPAKRASCNGAR